MRQKRRNSSVVFLGGWLLASALALGAGCGGSEDDGGPAPQPTPLPLGTVTGRWPLEPVRDPFLINALAWDGETLWLAGCAFHRASLTASGLTPAGSFPSPHECARSMGWDGTQLWVLDNEVVTPKILRIGPTGALLGSIRPPTRNVTAVAWGEGVLWVSDYQHRIYKVSPTGSVLGSFNTPSDAQPSSLRAVAWGGGFLWVVHWPSTALGHVTLFKLTATGEVVASVPLESQLLPENLAWKDGFLWAINREAQRPELVKISGG